MTESPFILETERLGLTLWSEADIEPLARLHGDEETTRYLSIRRIWTNEDAASRIAIWMQEWREHGTTKLKLVRRSDGLMVGRAGFGIMADSGEYELGYTIDRHMRGKGYATEISLGLAQWFFARGLGEHFIACADVDNSASNRVLEKIGMRFERSQSWLGKSEHGDDWIFCLTVANMATNRRDDDETTPPQPHTGVQGEGGPGGTQGREDPGRVGAAV